MIEKTISNPQKFRYFISNNIENKTIKKVLIVLHGYGQLAPFFIKNFDTLKKEYVIVAPEGPHRFYLSGTSGRVGASWMTKEAREMDIENNLSWLQGLFEEIQTTYSFENVYLLGFSQGGPMAARWYNKNPNQFNKLILWAAVFPPDVSMPDLLETTAKKYFVIGSQDQYFSEIRQKEMIDLHSTLNFEILTYNGKHNLDKETLHKIFT